VRAGDNHHGNRPFQREGQILTQRQPDNKRSRSYGDGDNRQPECSAVGQVLSTRAGLLGLTYQVDNLSQVGVLARALHLDNQRPFAVERPTDDLVAHPFGHRLGLTGEHGFVDVGRAFDHHAVHGDLLPRADAHSVVGFELTDGHVLLRTVG